MSIKYVFTQKTRVFDDVLSLPTSNSLHISNPPQPYFFNQRTQQLVKDSSTSLPCSHISNKSCHQVVLLDLSNSPKSFQIAKLIGFFQGDPCWSDLGEGVWKIGLLVRHLTNATTRDSTSGDKTRSKHLKWKDRKRIIFNAGSFSRGVEASWCWRKRETLGKSKQWLRLTHLVPFF